MDTSSVVMCIYLHGSRVFYDCTCINSTSLAVRTTVSLDVCMYHIAQNSDGGKLWRINHFRVLAGKTLANLNF